MPANRAPGSLRLVQELVNSVDLESGRDELSSPEALRAWLSQRNLLDDRELVTETDREWTIEIREALRTLLAANAGHDAGVDGSAEAIAVLNRAARAAALRVAFSSEGARLEPDASGLYRAVAEILATAFVSMVEGTWERLKVCVNDACLWAFYDHSKNRSGKWCTMEVCGNRMKARAYRERQAAGG